MDTVLGTRSSRSGGGLLEFDLDASSSELCAKVQPIEFKRVISNLLNIAIEALGYTGRVSIHLSSEGDFVGIHVSDNGPGIPDEIVEKLGRAVENVSVVDSCQEDIDCQQT